MQNNLNKLSNFYYDVISDSIRMDFCPDEFLPNDMAVDELIDNIDLSADCGKFLIEKIENISTYQARAASDAVGQRKFDFIRLGLILVVATTAGYLFALIALNLPGEYCFAVSIVFLLFSLVLYYATIKHNCQIREKEAIERGSFAEHALNELLARRQKTDFFTNPNDEVQSQSDFEDLLLESQELVKEVNFETHRDTIEEAMMRR